VLRIGIDIGGTKTELIALDGDGGERLRRRVATPHAGYAEAVESLAGLVIQAEKDLGARATVGLGVPGIVSPSGTVRSAFNTPYNDRPLGPDLEQLLGREVRVANDANCFALSESVDGAARGGRLVFGAILGTGAGAGIVADGRLVEGANRGSGEWGHNPLPWMTPEEYPGPPCYCGRHGCIEQFVSGPALAADHERQQGERLGPGLIAARADAGDAACLRSLERLESRLARALAHVVNLLDPDVIVLGGGLSRIRRLYEEIPRRWRAYTYTVPVATRLVAPAHGDASGVRGAAALWDRPG
jgi:predicted NBD/HSP70 family sugar kinase